MTRETYLSSYGFAIMLYKQFKNIISYIFAIWLTHILLFWEI